jgi:hypothetical protein
VLLTQNGGGHEEATWRPASAARYAARQATSVLPKPTSPQISRSIGRRFCMSASTSSVALRWSGVSSQRKRASNSSYEASGAGNAVPSSVSRAATTASSASAMSCTARRTRDFVRVQPCPPKRSSAGLASSADA